MGLVDVFERTKEIHLLRRRKQRDTVTGVHSQACRQRVGKPKCVREIALAIYRADP